MKIQKSDTGGICAVKSVSTNGVLNPTHIYYMSAEIKAENGTTYLHFGSADGQLSNNTEIYTSDSSQFVKLDQISYPNANTNVLIIRLGVQSTAAGSYSYVRNIFCIDLTATFGSGNEPELSECRELFTDDYYWYNIFSTYPANDGMLLMKRRIMIKSSPQYKYIRFADPVVQNICITN